MGLSADLVQVQWQYQTLANSDYLTSLNLEESACLSRLRSGRNPTPSQRKDRQILCLQGRKLWKSQPLILIGVCGWQTFSSRVRQCPATADGVH